MSYCVNCGVELDASLENCPLCNTPVLNPNDISHIKKAQPPFPVEKGQVEEVKRKDLGILFTVLLSTIAITCGLLNFLVFNISRWSLLVIGVCMIVWVLLVPVVIYRKLSIHAALLFDGLAVALYLYMITFVTHTDRWFWELALPITVFVAGVFQILALCARKIQKSILVSLLIFFVQIAVLCVGLELLIDRYLENLLMLSWSAVVLTVCVTIGIVLITMLSQKRIRNAVRRRLHF